MKYFFIIFLFCNLFLGKLYSEDLVRKVTGYSEVEKYILSNKTTISHYKNKGTWTNNKGNYGTETCKGTIVINSQGLIIDYLLFCNGKDFQGHTFTAKYNRTSDMVSGTGFYIYIDGTGSWKKKLEKSVITQLHI